MKARILVAATLVAALGGGAFWFVHSSPSQAAGARPAAAAAGSRTGSRAARLALAAHDDHRAAAGAVAGPPVMVAAGQQIASVGGHTITGRQLLAWRAGDPAQQEMSAAMFASLKERAIDRELTFAEARRQGIDLTAAQQAQLGDVRRNAQARGETDVAQLDFEENDARAHMLASTLLDKAGIAQPFATDADVKAYFDEHAAELDELPVDPAARAAAWQKLSLEIRETLATERQQQYEQALRDYFAKLRAAAHVD